MSDPRPHNYTTSAGFVGDSPDKAVTISWEGREIDGERDRYRVSVYFLAGESEPTVEIDQWSPAGSLSRDTVVMSLADFEAILADAPSLLQEIEGDAGEGEGNGD